MRICFCPRVRKRTPFAKHSWHTGCADWNFDETSSATGRGLALPHLKQTSGPRLLTITVVVGVHDHVRLRSNFAAQLQWSIFFFLSSRQKLRALVTRNREIKNSGLTVQPEFFKFPRRNVPLGICLSTDFSAFSSFRRETCESTSPSALIFVPFQEQKKVWRGVPGIFVDLRCIVLFFPFFCSIPCVVFSKGGETRFGEGLLGLKKVTLTERQTCFLNINLLLSGLGVWAG